MEIRNTRRYLTDEDAEAIATAFAKQQQHACRFHDIDRDRMMGAITTSEHIEAVTKEIGSAVRVTLVKGGLWAVGVLLFVGLMVKLREWLKLPIP